jgi:cytochrome c oxidase cbb3-type subunit 3
MIIATRVLTIRRIKTVLLLFALALLFSCQREERNFRITQASQVAHTVPNSELHPGGPTPTVDLQNPFQGNAYAISEGQRLFGWYNCVGCHAHGGGGIGPALADSTWLYGGQPANVFESIAKGRPNGMPAWGAKIPEYQIWQLTSYVQSLSGAQPVSAVPARSDEMEKSSVQPKTSGNPR